MLKKLKTKFFIWLADELFQLVRVGGHCGLCGKWIPDRVVPSWWRWVLCDDCINDGIDEQESFGLTLDADGTSVESTLTGHIVENDRPGGEAVQMVSVVCPRCELTWSEPVLPPVLHD